MGKVTRMHSGRNTQRHTNTRKAFKKQTGKHVNTHTRKHTHTGKHINMQTGCRLTPMNITQHDPAWRFSLSVSVTGISHSTEVASSESDFTPITMYKCASAVGWWSIWGGGREMAERERGKDVGSRAAPGLNCGWMIRGCDVTDARQLPG